MSTSTASSSATSPGGKGKHETLLLKSMISDQLARLLTQLEDLEELKEEFSTQEYNEIHQETTDQLREFEIFLAKSLSGDLTLVDEFGSAQLAIQAAISSAFKTPEVIRMFANKQPDQLRLKLTQLQRDVKIKKISREVFIRQSVEILLALQRLNTELSEEEELFVKQHMSSSNQLESTTNDNGVVDDSTQHNLIQQAHAQIKQAEQ